MIPRMGRFWLVGGSIASHIISAVLALAIVALLVLTIIMLVRNIRLAGKMQRAAAQPNNVTLSGGEADPLKILDERFAKGEINEEEYMRKKEMLKKT